MKETNKEECNCHCHTEHDLPNGVKCRCVKMCKHCSPDFKFKIEVAPSPRIDFCRACGKEHGYDCPKDTDSSRFTEIDKSFEEELKIKWAKGDFDSISGEFIDAQKISEFVSEFLHSAILEDRQRRKAEIVDTFYGRAREKAKILEKEFGAVPILFEEAEILNIIKNER